MTLYDDPVFYGIRDVTIPADGAAFAARIYFPSHDGAVFTAPIRPGTYPLVVFAHGDRSGETHLCPPDRTGDHRRWDAVLHLLARCGFVVLSPAVHDVVSSSEAAAARLETAIRWLRTEWEHRVVLRKPDVFIDPDRHAPLSAEGGRVRADVSRFGVSHLGVGTGVNIDLPGSPTALGLVGHSWGARACARVAFQGDVHVQALAAIAGSWDEQAAIQALVGAERPTLLIAGTADFLNASYPTALWPSLAAPKYQAMLQDLGHWDWFGGQGGIQPCDDDAQRPPCPVGWLTAAELVVGFLVKYLAGRWYQVPSLVGSSGPRSLLLDWYDADTDCAAKIRWDDPLAPLSDGHHDEQGELSLGHWSSGNPW